MEPSQVSAAVEAGRSVVSGLGLHVDDAVVVSNSNRIAVRLTPCDVLARIAPPARQASAAFEVEVARRLGQGDHPVAELEPRVDPRVYSHDGFAVTLWTYYESVVSSDIAPAEYSHALTRLHAGLRQLDVRAPDFTDRVADAQRLLADEEQSPELSAADRKLLVNALTRLTTMICNHGIGEQLLHGEPHLGNLLKTWKGPLFIDLETCCRGPVEFDIAHGLLPKADGYVLSAEELCEHYPDADQDLIEQCRILIWAMITTWRWDREDQLPNGRYWANEWLNQLRAALDRYGLDLDD
jgi:Ser/Thr protein kinase RdoA (MazF antagonist)